MLHCFNVNYFNFALVFAALFNVVLFLLFYYLTLHYFNIALFNVTIDEYGTSSSCPISIALLMPHVVLTVTSNCTNS